MGNKIKVLGLLLGIIILSTFFVWLPFFTNGKMAKVFANYDGPNYIVIAKCWYQKQCIAQNFSLPLPLEYYPAHFPGYPLIISFFDLIFPGWWAMIFGTIIGTTALGLTFYALLKLLKIKQFFWLVILLMFLPARMLILRSVGAPETLFLSTIIASIFFYKKGNYLFSGIFLMLAQTIKTPAILLFFAYLTDIAIKHWQDLRKLKFRKILPYWGISLGFLIILPIFWLYKIQTGDFFAYFKSGDNFHLVFPPFQTFISSRSWLGDFWLEDILYIYFVGGLAISQLYKKYKTDILFIFPTIFWFATLFVAHRDISRYSSPLYPFWILAFSNLLVKKEFKVIFLLLLPAVYLYAINFITYNIAPIADWTPYF